MVAERFNPAPSSQKYLIAATYAARLLQKLLGTQAIVKTRVESAAIIFSAMEISADKKTLSGFSAHGFLVSAGADLSAAFSAAFSASLSAAAEVAPNFSMTFQALI